MHLGSSRFFFWGGYKGQEVAVKLLEEIEKKKEENFARQKLKWLLPISSVKSRPRIEVVTCRAPSAQGKGAERATGFFGSRVVTSI